MWSSHSQSNEAGDVGRVWTKQNNWAGVLLLLTGPAGPTVKGGSRALRTETRVLTAATFSSEPNTVVEKLHVR